MSGQCWTLVSGKGGVGKSTLAAALGAHLALAGRRVALVDLNTGMRGLDMLLGRLEIFPMLLLFMPGAWKRS